MVTQRTRTVYRQTAVLSMMTCALVLLADITLVVAADWSMSNHDPSNSRSQPMETTKDAPIDILAVRAAGMRVIGSASDEGAKALALV